MPRSPVLVLVLALGLGTTACRGCESSAREAPEASGPTMPTGMLSPLPGVDPPTEPSSPAERLAVGRGKTGGPWAELQVARANDGPERRAFERWQPDSKFSRSTR